MMAIALGAIAGITLLLVFRTVRLEWRLLRAENDSLRPFSDRLYQLVSFWLEQTTEPVIFLARDGTINGVSNAAERMLGQRSVLLTGRPIGSFFADGCEAQAAIARCLATGEDIKRQTVTMTLRHAPGRTVDLVAKRHLTSVKEEWWILFKG
jgi:nitrogen-specific signal transduction histidine kinase